MHGRQKKRGYKKNAGRCDERVRERERGEGEGTESTNKSSGETMLLKVANCPALLLPSAAGWTREAVFHLPELINDPRRKKGLTRHSTHSLKRLYRCECSRSERCRVLAPSIILPRMSIHQEESATT